MSRSRRLFCDWPDCEICRKLGFGWRWFL